ncbi:MAG: NAD(P)H-dependent oxidoreductase [Bacteroidota bacterium]
MAKILAFAGSNSSTSINYQLVKHSVSLIGDHEIQLLNMVNYPFPMYSADLEKEEGYSNSLVELKNDIQKSDALLLSVNEHNSNPSAYFKNVLDWLSRLERKFLQDKKILLMSASMGKRGGIGALSVVEVMLPRFGADIISTFALASYGENFSKEKGILDAELAKGHEDALARFLKAL